MIRIAINNANILIDLCDIDLLNELTQLNLELHTTDFVINEIRNVEQINQLNKIIADNKLIINSFNPTELLAIILKNQSVSSLSIQDCSVWHIAELKNAMILTGDNVLRKTVKKHDIEVHGILWILDELIIQKIISKYTAYEKLVFLMEINPRLPKKACTERLENWK